jgi:general stress protein 26
VYRNTGRLVFFSDGVFAITITLLVLEIRPPTDYRDLLHGLGEHWPSYLAYAVMFLFIGQVWANHPVMFDHIRAAGRQPRGKQPVMTTPRTELDTRFSEPGALPTSWEDTLQAIKQAEIFWISTVRTEGRPHVTPLVAVWLDDALHFSTGPEEQKARNLAGNPRVALTTGANDWQSGLDVVVEGEAARVTDAQQLDRLAAAWAQKWDGRWQYEVSQDGFRHDVGTALVFAVRPAKVLAFTKGGFSHTRHRF